MAAPDRERPRPEELPAIKVPGRNSYIIRAETMASQSFIAVVGSANVHPAASLAGFPMGCLT